jgi:hypothetical protein
MTEPYNTGMQHELPYFLNVGLQNRKARNQCALCVVWRAKIMCYEQREKTKTTSDFFSYFGHLERSQKCPVDRYLLHTVSEL